MVSPGGIIRMGPDVRGKVYTWDGTNWTLSGNKVRVPEGWFAGSLEPEEE